MKQVTYQINGIVDVAMKEALSLSCANVPGVTQASLSLPDGGNAWLTLSMTEDPTEDQERMLASVFETKGLELLLDTCRIRELGAPVAPAEEKPRERKVSLTAAIASMVTAVILAVLVTFSVTTAYLRRETPPTADVGGGKNEPTVFDQMAFLDKLFRELTVKELDENFETYILKSYVAATGDYYAEYFTAEELKSLTGEQNGEMCGIGMSVVNGTCTVGGINYQSIVVANVYPDSPAEAAGVLPGDFIMYVGIGEDRVLINEIGYTEALDRMAGEEGTTCSFVVFRYNAETEAYDELEFSAVREKMTTRSVTGRVYGPDNTVGVIKITGFDNTTSPQFVETVETLQSKGCTSFVLDLRGNPGGLLTSVEDMLVYFLEEGDTMISTKDSKGYESVTKLTVGENGLVRVGTRTLKQSDIGKYRDLDFTVLVNGYSASAAELFTANMRDHEIAEIVGVKTFGKGSMQSTIPLSQYGYEGALKLTTAYYYPPSGEGYDGIGITPDVVVDLDEELKKININLLTDEQDNQLAEAVKALKPAD